MITPLPPKPTRENGAQHHYSTQNNGWVSLGQLSGRIPDVEISHEFLWIFHPQQKRGQIWADFTERWCDLNVQNSIETECLRDIIHKICQASFTLTPPETYIAPENRPMEKEYWKTSFLGSMLVSDSFMEVLC